MNDKVNGFILTIQDYKDSDVLMRVLTKDYGIISIIAKSAKKLNSKNHFLNLCIYEFIIDYVDNKTIFNVHGSKLLNNYYEDNNIEMISFENLLIELVIKNEDINTYDQIKFVFDNLKNNNKYLLGSLFISYIIKKFGIAPIVDGCCLCDNKKVIAISNLNGGFLCQNHVNGQELLPVERLRKFRLINKADFDNYDVIKDIEFDFKDFDLMMSFYLTNTDLKLKTYDFYRSLI